MEWIILFYETPSGERIIENFIAKQQPQARGKIGHLIDLLEQYGSMLRMPHAKQLDTNLYELQCEVRKRFVYSMDLKSTLSILSMLSKSKRRKLHRKN